MSVRFLLTSPGGVTYDMASGTLHDVVDSSLPDLVLQLEDDDGKVSTGDVSLEFGNADGWFDTEWADLDPEDYYDFASGIGCWTINIEKNGASRWVGDLDVESVEFNEDTRLVTATFLGQVKRLEHYNATYVKRAIPAHSDSGTATWAAGVTADATTSGTYGADELINHRIVAGGLCYTITDNGATVGGVTAMTVAGGTPANGAYELDPMVWSTQRITYPRILEVRDNADASNGPTIADLGLVAYDVIKYTKLKADGKIIQQDLEIIQTKTTGITGLGPDAALGDYQVRVRSRLKAELNANASAICDTPYYRMASPATLAGYLFTYCGIAPGDTEVNLTAFPSDNLVPYADFKDKTVAEAFAELAVVCNAVLFATPSKWYFITRDVAKSGSVSKDISQLLIEHRRGGLWDKFVNLITVKGSVEDRFYRKGGLTFPQREMEVETDFADTNSWLQQIGERLYGWLGVRRRPAEVAVLDDGTAYQLWDKVSPDGDDHYVVEVTEPLRSVDGTARSSVTLKLVRCAGTAPTTGDGEATDQSVDNTDPPPPTDLAMTKVYSDWPNFRVMFPKEDYPKFHYRLVDTGGDNELEDLVMVKRRLWAYRFKWGNDDLRGRLLGFHAQRYPYGGDRDKPLHQYNLIDPQMAGDIPGCATPDPYYYGWFYQRAGRRSSLDVQAIYEDGRHGAWSDMASTETEYESTDYLFAVFGGGKNPGIYYSLDGGQHWNICPSLATIGTLPLTGSYMKGISQRYSESRLLFSYTSLPYKAFKNSDNYGSSFNAILFPSVYASELCYHPAETIQDATGDTYTLFVARNAAASSYSVWRWNGDGVPTYQECVGNLGGNAFTVHPAASDVNTAYATGLAAVWECQAVISDATPTFTRVRNANINSSNILQWVTDPTDATPCYACANKLYKTAGGPGWGADAMKMVGEVTINDGNATDFGPGTANLALIRDMVITGSRWVVAGLCAAGKQGIYTSDDSGANWTGRGPVGFAFCNLTVNPNNPDHLVAASDPYLATASDGVYVSMDGGDTWTHYNQGAMGEWASYTVDGRTAQAFAWVKRGIQ